MINRFRCCFLALFLSVCATLVSSAQTAQTNIIALGAAGYGKQTVFFFPASVSNYVLQAKTSLASTNWMPVTNLVMFTAYAVSNTLPAQFFRLYLAPISPAGMTLVPAGIYTMGDSLDNLADAVPVSVTVSNVYMDINLVTYGQWQTIYNYASTNGYTFVNSGAGKATNEPVESVDWYDAIKWSNARSQQAGLTPVYYTDAALTMLYTNGEVTPYVNWNAKGFRLPTEAEWEIAARGGLTGQRFPWGNTISQSQATYYTYEGTLVYDLGGLVSSGFNPTLSYGSYPYTSIVGAYSTNNFGLYDMAGNVAEWCWDWYGTPYPGGTNPHGATSGTYRVLRGGDWLHSASTVRTAFRSSDPANTATTTIGFRCVRN